MSTDRDVERMLHDDPNRSYRSISRELGISDWLVRKIARELDGDPRPMKQRHSKSDEPVVQEVSPLVGWLVFGGFVGALALAIWAGARYVPPDSTDFPHGFYSNPPTERTDNETQFPE